MTKWKLFVELKSKRAPEINIVSNITIDLSHGSFYDDPNIDGSLMNDNEILVSESKNFKNPSYSVTSYLFGKHNLCF